MVLVCFNGGIKPLSFLNTRRFKLKKRLLFAIYAFFELVEDLSCVLVFIFIRAMLFLFDGNVNILFI